MTSKERIFSISKSLSLDSPSIQPTPDRSIFASTRDQEKSLKISNDDKRRKATLPTPNKPKHDQNLDNKKGLGSDEQMKTLKDGQCQSQDQNTTVHNVYGNDVNDTEIRLHLDQDLNDDSFDTFVLQNFVTFSGRQDVNQWVDETENRFNQFHIGRNLRYDAISLLVKGEAKRKYLKFRKEIHSFDDFYEFLLSKFESLDNASFQSKSCQTMVDNSSELLTSYEAKLENESEQFVSNNNKTLNSTCHSSITNPTTMDILVVTNDIGEKPVVKSAANLDSTSNSICDQTLNDLRKAIVGNLI